MNNETDETSETDETYPIKAFFGFHFVYGGQPSFWGALIAFQNSVSQHIMPVKVLENSND